METNLENNKKRFIDLIKQNVKREGVLTLLEWLEKTDFFTAPASTRFHSACEGGLCAHSLLVYDRFVKLLQMEYGEDWTEKCSIESAVLIALFHDLCKADYYTVEMRNVKENGTWVQKPYYAIADKLPYGHGEKSVYIINGFIRLTREEAMAINWHMGEYDMRVKAGADLKSVYYKYPIAFLFHIADNMATYLDEEC
ncbi:MAG: hydrolase [Clostridia bacterium]|nr:hydrolase [Clostridia bacterium]